MAQASLPEKTVTPVEIPVPDDFTQHEALQRINRLLVELLHSEVISEREITKRLIRYHPAPEGV